jgi:ElaB/YqjD/DUF883 family membrane-anchored ribosome-binding protein
MINAKPKHQNNKHSKGVKAMENLKQRTSEIIDKEILENLNKTHSNKSDTELEELRNRLNQGLFTKLEKLSNNPDRVYAQSEIQLVIDELDIELLDEIDEYLNLQRKLAMSGIQLTVIPEFRQFRINPDQSDKLRPCEHYDGFGFDVRVAPMKWFEVKPIMKHITMNQYDRCGLDITNLRLEETENSLGFSTLFLNDPDDQEIKLRVDQIALGCKDILNIHETLFNVGSVRFDFISNVCRWLRKAIGTYAVPENEPNNHSGLSKLQSLNTELDFIKMAVYDKYCTVGMDTDKEQVERIKNGFKHTVERCFEFIESESIGNNIVYSNHEILEEMVQTEAYQFDCAF